jgi:hypothetical protein
MIIAHTCSLYSENENNALQGLNSWPLLSWTACCKCRQMEAGEKKPVSERQRRRQLLISSFCKAGKFQSSLTGIIYQQNLPDWVGTLRRLQRQKRGDDTVKSVVFSQLQSFTPTTTTNQIIQESSRLSNNISRAIRGEVSVPQRTHAIFVSSSATDI